MSEFRKKPFVKFTTIITTFLSSIRADALDLQSKPHNPDKTLFNTISSPFKGNIGDMKVFGEYSDTKYPLILKQSSGNTVPLIEGLQAFELSYLYEMTDKLQLGILVPGEKPYGILGPYNEAKVNLGNILIEPKVYFSDNIALIPIYYAPSKNKKTINVAGVNQEVDVNMPNGAYGAKVALGLGNPKTDDLITAFQIGAIIAPESKFREIDQTLRIQFGAGIKKNLSGGLKLLAEAYGEKTKNNTPLEALAMIEYSNDNFMVRFGGGTGDLQSSGSNTSKLLANFAYYFGDSGSKKNVDEEVKNYKLPEKPVSEEKYNKFKEKSKDVEKELIKEELKDIETKLKEDSENNSIIELIEKEEPQKIEEKVPQQEEGPIEEQTAPNFLDQTQNNLPRTIGIEKEEFVQTFFEKVNGETFDLSKIAQMPVSEKSQKLPIHAKEMFLATIEKRKDEDDLGFISDLDDKDFKNLFSQDIDGENFETISKRSIASLEVDTVNTESVQGTKQKSAVFEVKTTDNHWTIGKIQIALEHLHSAEKKMKENLYNLKKAQDENDLEKISKIKNEIVWGIRVYNRNLDSFNLLSDAYLHETNKDVNKDFDTKIVYNNLLDNAKIAIGSKITTEQFKQKTLTPEKILQTSKVYQVEVKSVLNVRTSPKILLTNVIGKLNDGDLVEAVTGELINSFVAIKVLEAKNFNKNMCENKTIYVHHKYIKEVKKTLEIKPQIMTSIPETQEKIEEPIVPKIVKEEVEVNPLKDVSFTETLKSTENVLIESKKQTGLVGLDKKEDTLILKETLSNDDLQSIKVDIPEEKMVEVLDPEIFKVDITKTITEIDSLLKDSKTVKGNSEILKKEPSLVLKEIDVALETEKVEIPTEELKIELVSDQTLNSLQKQQNDILEASKNFKKENKEESRNNFEMKNIDIPLETIVVDLKEEKNEIKETVSETTNSPVVEEKAVLNDNNFLDKKNTPQEAVRSLSNQDEAGSLLKKQTQTKIEPMIEEDTTQFEIYEPIETVNEIKLKTPEPVKTEVINPNPTVEPEKSEVNPPVKNVEETKVIVEPTPVGDQKTNDSETKIVVKPLENSTLIKKEESNKVEDKSDIKQEPVVEVMATPEDIPQVKEENNPTPLVVEDQKKENIVEEKTKDQIALEAKQLKEQEELKKKKQKELEEIDKFFVLKNQVKENSKKEEKPVIKKEVKKSEKTEEHVLINDDSSKIMDQLKQDKIQDQGEPEKNTPDQEQDPIEEQNGPRLGEY